MIFEKKLDNDEIHKAQQLLSDVSFNGFAFVGIASESQVTGTISFVHLDLLVNALFASKRTRAVIYTIIDAPVTVADTALLHLDGNLAFAGVLNDSILSNDGILKKLDNLYNDKKILESIAKDSFGYTKMPDGKRLRDSELANITNTEIRQQATAKGCGPKCLLKLADKINNEIDQVAVLYQLQFAN